jgi:hypothetical protein
LRALLAGIDPALMTGDDCRVLAEELAMTAKSCSAAAARLAAQAAECGAHRRVGFRDAQNWLARASGTTAAEAATAMEIGKALEHCPATKQALVDGALSLIQAKEIVRAEAARPGAEAQLSALAKRSDIQTLRDAARKQRLEAVDPQVLYRRQRQARSFRHWRDELGMVQFKGALAPDVGVAFVNRVDREADRIHREQRRQGSTEPRDAHAADAFTSIVEGKDKAGRGRTDLVLVADIAAWTRGHAHDGEVSHIVGGGPVPISVMRELATDAFVKAVLHDGNKIDTVVHYGRHIPAELRTVIELGDPPDFDGITCTEPGCGRRHGLELDHFDPKANGGHVSYENINPRCKPHHWDKTERDRAAGLLVGRANSPPDPPPD